MSIDQLEALAQRQKRLHVLMYTSEAVICTMLFFWGLQLCQKQDWQYDPISEALKQFTPFIVPKVHGIALMFVCVSHALFMGYNVPGWRRYCILAEMGFLFFVEYDLILAFIHSHLFIPGLYGVPVLIMFSFLNFVSLYKPKPVEQGTGECRKVN